MNLFLILAMILWVGTIAMLAVGLVVGVIVSLIKRRRKMALGIAAMTGLAMVVVTGMFVALFYWWSRPYDPTSTAELEEAYRAEFQVKPPAGVQVLSARQIVVGDSGRQWMLFRAPPEEITRLLGMGFQKESQAPLDFAGSKSANAPDWWRPPEGHMEYFSNTNWTKTDGWTTSWAELGLDRSSNLVWMVVHRSN